MPQTPRSSDSESPFVIDPTRWAKARMGTIGVIISFIVGAVVWSMTVKIDLAYLKEQNDRFALRMDLIESRAQQEREFRIQLAEGVNYIVRSVDKRRDEKPAPIVAPNP